MTALLALIRGSQACRRNRYSNSRRKRFHGSSSSAVVGGWLACPNLCKVEIDCLVCCLFILGLVWSAEEPTSGAWCVWLTSHAIKIGGGGGEREKEEVVENVKKNLPHYNLEFWWAKRTWCRQIIYQIAMWEMPTHRIKVGLRCSLH